MVGDKEDYRPQEALHSVHERQAVSFSDRSEEFFFPEKSDKQYWDVSSMLYKVAEAI